MSTTRAGVNQKWTAEKCARTIAVLRVSRTIEVACATLTAEFGFEVTAKAMQAALARHCDTTCGAHLGVDLAAEALVDNRDDGAETERRMPVFSAGALPDDSCTTSVPQPPMSDPEMSRAEILEHRFKEKVSILEGRTKRLIAELAAKEDELRDYKMLWRPPQPIEEPKRVGATQRCGVPLMVLSDWHVEEPVDPAKVNGLNEYNLAIADGCIAKIPDAFEWLLRDARYDCRTAIIALLGDLISGFIHPELIENNELSPQDTMVWLLDRLERMFRKILALTTLEKIIVPCTSGNHGRATEKQRVSTRESNSNEQVVYQTLARVLRDEPRIEFNIAQGQWVELDVMGFGIACTHGDSFQYGGGVGGMSIPIRRGIAREFAGRRFHQYLMGHFHQRQDFGDVQINGSLIGYSPYSQRIHAAPEKRQQSFFMIDSKHGKSITAPVWVD